MFERFTAKEKQSVLFAKSESVKSKYLHAPNTEWLEKNKLNLSNDNITKWIQSKIVLNQQFSSEHA